MYSADRPDLGEAWDDSYDHCFAKGYDVVTNIAPDSPDITQDYLSRELRMTDTHDVVIGPSTDGGYYLLAMRGMRSTVFSDVSWGTEDIFKQVVENAYSLGSSLHVLPVWYDVDNLFQMKFMTDHLAAFRISGQLPSYYEKLAAFVEGLGTFY